MTDFQKMIQGLEQAKVPCNVKLFNSGKIDVECGWDYPDEIFFKVDEVAERLGIDVGVCAKVSGGVLEIQQRVCGGPRRY
jgi:hypothetical protein